MHFAFTTFHFWGTADGERVPLVSCYHWDLYEDVVPGLVLKVVWSRNSQMTNLKKVRLRTYILARTFFYNEALNNQKYMFCFIIRDTVLYFSCLIRRKKNIRFLI